MYLAIEWTSAAFHAYRLAEDGNVLDEKSSGVGVIGVERGGFEAALHREVGEWLADADAVLLAGMITSRNGWIESPYAETPASPKDIATKSARLDIAGAPPLFFLPGVAQLGPVPDVMRGEEIAILGMDTVDGTVVLPGAHSKWIGLEAGAIRSVTTYLSGELLGFLRTASIVSRLIPAKPVHDEMAFSLGVGNSADRPFGHLFSARSLPLFEKMLPEHIPSYLEGLIIGAELREQMPSVSRILLPTGHAVSARYEKAANLLGMAVAPADINAARGFHRVYRSLAQR